MVGPAAAGHCRRYPINRISPLRTLSKYTAGLTMFVSSGGRDHLIHSLSDKLNTSPSGDISRRASGISFGLPNFILPQQYFIGRGSAAPSPFVVQRLLDGLLMRRVDQIGAVRAAVRGVQAELAFKVVGGADLVAVRHAIDRGGYVLAVRHQND